MQLLEVHMISTDLERLRGQTLFIPIMNAPRTGRKHSLTCSERIPRYARRIRSWSIPFA